jgi:enoyl-CoA hydratase
MIYNNLLFSVENRIALITFNRPKALNALNSELLNELDDVLTVVMNDESIKVLILTGAGDKAFVAGADITELARFNALEARLFGKKGQSVINRLQELPIPVIAAVNGFALGGGSEIALAADFIYASTNAKFGFPEINLGLIPGFGGTQRGPRTMGMGMAKELIFTGKMVSAEEAATMGMVNRVCSSEALMESVYKTAEAISAKGKVSLRAAKKAVNNGMNVDLANGCEIELNEFAICFASQDSKEGTAAFLEKRKPDFKGGFKG